MSDSQNSPTERNDRFGEGHSIDQLAEWHDTARENVEKWGNQYTATILLALMEEVGETADEILYHTDIGDVNSEEARKARELIQDIHGLGIRTRAFLEHNFEDPAGNPETEPTIDGRDIATPAVFPDEVIDEVDDIAPLVLQLRWALEDEVIR